MSEAAQWAIAVIVLINCFFVGGIAVALWRLHTRTAEALRQAQPLLDRAEQLLGKVEALTAKADGRLTGMMDTADHLVRDVSQKVETTTAIAEETITQPLIGAASLMAGISRGLSTYKALSEKGEGQNHG